MCPHPEIRGWADCNFCLVLAIFANLKRLRSKDSKSLKLIFGSTPYSTLYSRLLMQTQKTENNLNHINIYELIWLCPFAHNMRMFSETVCSSQTKLIRQSLPIREHGIGYSNLTPDPQGARGGPGGQNSSFTKSKNFANKSCQAW